VAATAFDADAAPEIGKGEKGEWVTFLQQWLEHHGFELGATSGVFDDATETAVQSFQQRSRLEQTGRADRATWRVIALGGPTETLDPDSAPELRKGQKGGWVEYLQMLLAASGHPPSGGVDGDFSTGTRRAVRQFQDAHGLKCDGVVGLNTWTRLGVYGEGIPVPLHAPVSGTPAADAEAADDDDATAPGSGPGPLSTTLEPTGVHPTVAAAQPGFPITATVVPQSAAGQGWVTLDITVENRSHWTLEPVTYSWVASVRGTANFVGEGSGTIGRMAGLASTALQVSHQVDAPDLGEDLPIYQFIVMVFSTDTEYHIKSHEEVRAYYAVSSDFTVAVERD
jgi:peptidoglycan hydrolase-like protein with peptidoglycan-binding domain